MDNRRRIDALFDRALDLPTSERGSFVAALRLQEPDVAEAVEALLHSMQLELSSPAYADDVQAVVIVRCDHTAEFCAQFTERTAGRGVAEVL